MLLVKPLSAASHWLCHMGILPISLTRSLWRKVSFSRTLRKLHRLASPLTANWIWSRHASLSTKRFSHARLPQGNNSQWAWPSRHLDGVIVLLPCCPRAHCRRLTLIKEGCSLFDILKARPSNIVLEHALYGSRPTHTGSRRCVGLPFSSS